MTPLDMLKLVRRDLRMTIQQALAYKGGHDYAQNLRFGAEVAQEIADWIDQVAEQNLTIHDLDEYRRR